jgi:hypothetical protein
MSVSERPAIAIKRQQELLRRLLAHRQFAHAESLRRILIYLFERGLESGGPPVREQEIAIHALGRPADFDPKIDPIVRVSVASIRARLQQYFENEGRPEDLRLSMPKGQYRLQFEAAPPRENHTPAAARARFWSPYLIPNNPNLLVFTDLLFYRDGEGNYFRNIYLNDRSAGPREIRERLPLAAQTPLAPSFHFVSAGEMNCLLSLTRTFQELGASLEYRNSRFFAWADARHANLILLGGMRTNPFVRSLQGSLPLVMTPTSIEERGASADYPVRWQGCRHKDGELERLVEYALVTRRAGPVAGTTVTMISANHGRAIEGAGAYLTDESHLLGLEEALGRNTLPEHFQLLLKVEMLDYDEEVVDVGYVTHRLLPPAG